MLSKYTILHNKTKLEKKHEEMQKNETDTDPPWGNGEWARKSLLKKYFILLLLVTISETSCSLYGMKPRYYNLPKILIF